MDVEECFFFFSYGVQRGIILADFRGAFGGKKQVVAIIDVDCAVKDAFDDEDKKALEELAQLIAESCDF